MAKMKLALGSASDQKLGYLKEVVAEMALDAEIFTFEAKSGVSEQPMTSDEQKPVPSTARCRHLRRSPNPTAGWVWR